MKVKLQDSKNNEVVIHLGDFPLPSISQNSLKIEIQIEDDLLNGVEKYFESGDYPIGNDLGIVDKRFVLKISFISFSFLK